MEQRRKKSKKFPRNQCYQYVLGTLPFLNRITWVYPFPTDRQLFRGTAAVGDYNPSVRVMEHFMKPGGLQLSELVDDDKRTTVETLLTSHACSYHGFTQVSSTVDLTCPKSAFEYDSGTGSPGEYVDATVKRLTLGSDGSSASPMYLTEVLPTRDPVYTGNVNPVGEPWAPGITSALYSSRLMNQIRRFGNGRIGAQVSGRYVSINGVFISARYMSAVFDDRDYNPRRHNNSEPLTTQHRNGFAWTMQ